MADGDADKIDLSSFLMGCNALIAASVLVLLWFKGLNEYVNFYTVCLSMALAAQNFFFLLAARRSPSPFIIITAIYTIFFYELRIATLLWEPWSIVFVRNAFSAADLSHGLLFVIFSNVFVFMGVSMASEKYSGSGPLRARPNASLRLLLPVLLMGLGLLFESGYKLPAALKGYLGIFLNTEMFLLLLLVVGALYGGVMSKAQKSLVLCSIVAFVACRTAIGSRSAIFTLLISFLCAWFAVNGRVILRKKLYFVLIAMIPVAVGSFLLATYLRAPKVPVQFQPVFNRLGFLDMTSEIIASRTAYRGVVNFEHYLKSVVDSGLTPGFNVFDSPKAANLLSFIYNGIQNPSLKEVAIHYQSDMMTIYAEMYLLFGPIAGLMAIFTGAFIFQVLYGLSGGLDPVKSAALRAIVLMLFYTYFLGSFGIDWFIVDVIRGVVPFFALLYLFSAYVQAVPGRITGRAS